MLQILKHSVFTAILAGIVLSLSSCSCSVVGQELDPQQQALDTYEKYKNQKNAPKPEDMLLNTDPEPDVSEGFTSLFDGTDLLGWHPEGGTCTFEVANSEIVGTCVPGSKSTYLCTDKNDYKNFVFTCELKWEVDGNTGVQFRSKSKPGKDAKTVFGPQFEMEGLRKDDRDWSGGIYGQSCGGYFYPLWLKEHKAARAAQKTDDWNRLTISAKGNVIKTWLNGVPASHWVDDGTFSEGFFALQVHQGEAGTIHFKDIRVKELE